MTWFKNNGMKANADKFHPLVNSKEKFWAKVISCDNRSSEKQKLLWAINLLLISILIVYAQGPAKNGMRYIEHHRGY